MPVCSPNSSEPRDGLADTLVLTAPFISSLLPLNLKWLAPFLEAASALMTLNLPTFCAVDPPSDPGVSAADLLSVASAAPEFENPGARARVIQLAQRFLWYGVCQCSAGAALPTPPTPPTLPSGAPSINPPTTVQLPAVPCATWNLDFPYAAHTSIADYSDYFELPATATALRFVGGWSPTDATYPTPSHYFVFRAFQGTHASPIDLSIPLLSVVGPQDRTITVVPADGPWFYSWSNSSNDVGGRLTATVTAICGATGSGGATDPCVACPPDPILMATLTNIQTMLTLMQRQTTPFAYISGTAHHSLTGTGTVAVQGILGVLLNVSIPTRAGEVVGTPDTRFDVGWINFGTSDGYDDRMRIHSDSQLVFPAISGVWTIVAYTLLPGVSMTLTELIRES